MGYIWYNQAINSLFFEIEYENRFSMGGDTSETFKAKGVRTRRILFA